MKINKNDRILITTCALYAVGVVYSIKNVIDLHKENKAL